MPAYGSFGGKPLYDPVQEAKNLAKHDLPEPAHFRNCNSFTTTAGQEPGRGWLLMIQSDIAALNKDGLNDLNLADDIGSITIKDLVFIRALALTPGITGDGNAVFLVEVRDVRHLALNEFYGNPANAQYNVRAPSGAPNVGGPPPTDSFYSSSLKNGAPFTWQQIADDLWSQVNIPELGTTSPILPFTPNGNPEGFKFINVPAWKAYNEFLFRIGCAFALDPTATVGNRAKIYKIGDTDNLLTTAIANNRSNLLLDDYAIEGNRSKIPKNVIVTFHRFSLAYGSEATTTTDATQWSSTPIYTKTIADPNNTQGVENTANAIIWDDLPAQVNFDGTIANTQALSDRATERAADYYRMLATGGAIFHQTYAGIISDPGFFPKLKVSGVAYKWMGAGLFTEVVLYPPPIRITDEGHFSSDQIVNERLRTPDLGRSSFPIYPVHIQVCKVTGSTTTAHYFQGVVQREDSQARAFSNQEQCFIHALPPTPDPIVGDQVVARLMGPTQLTPVGGQATTLPLYEFC